MRILVVNPNTTASMTAKIGAAAQRIAAAGTEIVAVNPASGPVSIEGYCDEAMSLAGLLQVIGEEMIPNERTGSGGNSSTNSSPPSRPVATSTPIGNSSPATLSQPMARPTAQPAVQHQPPSPFKPAQPRF